MNAPTGDDTLAMVVRLIAIEGAAANEMSTPHDGRFVVEYDASRPADNAIGVHLVTTDDPRSARRFASMEQLQQFTDQLVTTSGGPPRLPLRAFHIEILRLDDAIREASLPQLAIRLEGRDIDAGAVDDSLCGARIGVDPWTGQPWLCGNRRPCLDHPDRGTGD